MSSSVDPLKLLNRGPAYLRNALQTTQTTKTLSAAERLNVRKKSTEVSIIIWKMQYFKVYSRNTIFIASFFADWLYQNLRDF